MPSPNQLPANENEHMFAHQEMVQFTDGELALAFRTTDDVLMLGPDSIHKYARNFDLDDMAIIRTKSGNVYGFAGGFVINKDRKLAFEFPQETVRVKIGEPCVIEGVGSTSDVESVMLRYKVTTPGSDMANIQVDKPSPFKALEAQVVAINNSRQK